MFKERGRYTLKEPVNVQAGDLLVCTIGQTGETIRECIGRTGRIDTIVTFDVDNEFGLKSGIGAIFGAAQKEQKNEKVDLVA